MGVPFHPSFPFVKRKDKTINIPKKKTYFSKETIILSVSKDSIGLKCICPNTCAKVLIHRQRSIESFETQFSYSISLNAKKV